VLGQALVGRVRLGRKDQIGQLVLQATSASNHSARVKKAQALPQLRTWLEAGCTFEVWSWAKRRGRWCCQRQALTPADVGAAG
jgi:hypothetical protein